MNPPNKDPTSGSVQVRQIDQTFKLEGVSRFKRPRESHNGIGEQGFRDLPQQPVRSRFFGLGLKITGSVLTILMIVTTLVLAYDFAQKETEKLHAKMAYGRAIHPLDYNGYPMANKAARDIIAANQYRDRWYRCIGEGETTVFIWTFIFLI